MDELCFEDLREKYPPVVEVGQVWKHKSSGTRIKIVYLHGFKACVIVNPDDETKSEMSMAMVGSIQLNYTPEK